MSSEYLNTVARGLLPEFNIGQTSVTYEMLVHGIFRDTVYISVSPVKFHYVPKDRTTQHNTMRDSVASEPGGKSLSKMTV